jgi:hypothetical protein
MLYQDKIAIKYAKHKDTLKLAEQYVPKSDMWYYKSLKYASSRQSMDDDVLSIQGEEYDSSS